MSRVFDLVLGIFREPGLVADLRDKELPENLSLVIRLAAGEGAALQCALDTTGETAETLVEASTFFLQQVLFAPGNDAYRVLGADSDAPQERLRDNYRWLMKWLHPDRNHDGWEAVYADRVNVAWQDLKTPDRRAHYDRRSPSTHVLAPMTATSLRRVVPVVPAPGGPLLSGSTVRRLPTLVLGTLVVAAAAMIGITYWAQSTTQREMSELQRDRAPSGDTPFASLDPGSQEGLTATDAAAVNPATATAAQSSLDVVEVVAEAGAPTAPVPDMPSDEPGIADVPVISAAPSSTGTNSEIVATADPAPEATVAEPAVVLIELPTPAEPAASVASAPDAVEWDQTPTEGDPPVATGHVATVALAKPVAAAETVTFASTPATPLPKAVEPAADSREPDTLPAEVAAAPAMAREPLPVKPSVPAAAPASVAKPVAVAAAPPRSLPDAHKPGSVVATQVPVAAAPPPQPTPRGVATSPQVDTAEVVESPAQPSTTVSLASSATPTMPNSTTVATDEVASTVVDVEPLPPQPTLAQHDAEALVREFASAYAAGDLARFDRLFTNSSSDVAALSPMRSRFGSTEMRYIEIQQIGWHAEAEQGRVRAHYRDTYVPRGRRKAIIESGVIEWTIRVDAGDARIASVARDIGES
jgi:hypothetical protein